MGKENLEKISSEKLLTAPEVIRKILRKHPEIIQATIGTYILKKHGEKSLDDRRLFRVWDINRHGLPKYENEITAIGSIVDVCPEKNCKHFPWDHSQLDAILWSYNEEHDPDYNSPHGCPKSFIFLDIEMKEPEVLEVITEVFKNSKEDWYILFSGGGFHVILDKLVNLQDLPKEYGRIIALFGDKVDSQKMKNWGEDLKKIGRNWQKVLEWGELVREKIGHIDEVLNEEGKEVHMIDLRHVAHSLKGVYQFCNYLKEEDYKPGCYYPCWNDPEKIGGFYLRISPKPGRDYPFLVAQKENGKIHFFRTVNDLLKSQKQQRLF